MRHAFLYAITPIHRVSEATAEECQQEYDEAMQKMQEQEMIQDMPTEDIADTTAEEEK